MRARSPYLRADSCGVTNMLLLIDIGNSEMTVGFHDGRMRRKVRCKTSLGVRAMMEETLRFISSHHMRKPDDAVVCSVVPPITPHLIAALKRTFGIEKPLEVTHTLRLGLRFRIRHPGKLGADRIANAAAAHRLFSGDKIVVDFGTATTCCLITARGDYKGGVILPGLGISADSLALKTACLPVTRIRPPLRVIGNTTEGNIRSGLFFGHAGAVERVLREMKREYYNTSKRKDKPAIKVIATGGYAGLITPYIKGITTVKPDLTLCGLRIIYELNR